MAAVVRPVAEWWLRNFGDIWHLATPQRVIGVLGIAWLFQASLAARTGRRSQPAVFGLLVAWFGLGAGALVALSRTDYFALLPLQVHATRYLPWSCLFWSGLVATSLAQYAASLRPIRVWAAVTALALVLLATNVGGHMWSGQMAKVAAEQSEAARQGRDPVEWLETDPAAFRAALEPARRHGVGPWSGQ